MRPALRLCRGGNDPAGCSSEQPRHNEGEGSDCNASHDCGNGMFNGVDVHKCGCRAGQGTTSRRSRARLWTKLPRAGLSRARLSRTRLSRARVEQLFPRPELWSTYMRAAALRGSLSGLPGVSRGARVSAAWVRSGWKQFLVLVPAIAGRLASAAKKNAGSIRSGVFDFLTGLAYFGLLVSSTRRGLVLLCGRLLTRGRLQMLVEPIGDRAKILNEHRGPNPVAGPFLND